MKLVFLGTRAKIEAASPAHRFHSTLEVTYYRRRVLVDCGADWKGRWEALRPEALILTHGHDDHAAGVGEDPPCPVWATAETWSLLDDRVARGKRRTVRPREGIEIAGIGFEAFPVEHSLRAPAVGYRISAGRVTVFYVPDVVFIPARREALAGCRLYVGDGSTLERSLLVRRRGDRLTGHVPFRTQLTWCAEEGVPRALATHCGAEVLRDEVAARQTVEALGRELGVDADLAEDGTKIVLR